MRAWAARRAVCKLLQVHSADADEVEEADDALDADEVDDGDDAADDDAADLPLNVKEALLLVREWVPNDAETTEDSE